MPNAEPQDKVLMTPALSRICSVVSSLAEKVRRDILSRPADRPALWVLTYWLQKLPKVTTPQCSAVLFLRSLCRLCTSGRNLRDLRPNSSRTRQAKGTSFLRTWPSTQTATKLGARFKSSLSKKTLIPPRLKGNRTGGETEASGTWLKKSRHKTYISVWKTSIGRNTHRFRCLFTELRSLAVTTSASRETQD